MRATLGALLGGNGYWCKFYWVLFYWQTHRALTWRDIFREASGASNVNVRGVEISRKNDLILHARQNASDSLFQNRFCAYSTYALTRSFMLLRFLG